MSNKEYPEVHFIVSPRKAIVKKIDEKYVSDITHYIVSENEQGVVLSAYEKDFEIYFECAFPTWIFYKEGTGKPYQDKKRMVFDIKKSDLKMIGWGRSSYEEVYWERIEKCHSTSFY